MIPGSGRSSGGGNGNPHQYSCLENPWTGDLGRLESMGCTKSQTGRSTQAHTTSHQAQRVPLQSHVCNTCLHVLCVSLKIIVLYHFPKPCWLWKYAWSLLNLPCLKQSETFNSFFITMNYKSSANIS